MQHHSENRKAVEALLGALRQSGVEMRDDAAERLSRLADLILEWNKAMNLISRRDVGRLVTYHFCDSASVLPIIHPQDDLEVVDIGGSNGLPGLVLACICARIKVTVCDSKLKREGFLKAASRVVGDNATYTIDRADGSDFQQTNRERFDLVVARAVTRLRHLLKWALPLVRPGGVIVAYKGSRVLEEIKPAEKHLLKAGRALIAMASPWAGWCNPLRNFVVVQKAC